MEKEYIRPILGWKKLFKKLIMAIIIFSFVNHKVEPMFVYDEKRPGLLIGFILIYAIIYLVYYIIALLPTLIFAYKFKLHITNKLAYGIITSIFVCTFMFYITWSAEHNLIP